MNRRLGLALALITLLAFGLRVYRQGIVPPSLYWDEVSIGYNAWSIATTGRDENGARLPFFFKAFGDYKLPGYVYSLAPLLKVTGPTPWAVRFPAALYGTLTVLLTFFLVRELFKVRVAVLTTLLLAISPWHLHFSRAGFEAVGGLFFQVAALTALLKARRKPYLLIVSVFLAAAAMLFYPTQRLFLPLMYLVVFWLEGRQRQPSKRWLAISIIVAAIVFVPLGVKFFSPAGRARARQVSITADSSPGDEFIDAAFRAGNPRWARLFYNPRAAYLRLFVANYTSHFSLPFLFTNGDAEGRHGPRGMGLMELWQLPFLLGGLAVVLRRLDFGSKVVLAWLVLAPLPAGLTVNAPHALRTLGLLPVPQILVALGVVSASLRWGRRFMVLVGVLLVSGLAATLVFYFDFTPPLTASRWGDGYPQLMAYLKRETSAYDQVYVSGYYWQPYIYALFYLRYPPAEYQRSGTPARFSHYYFGKSR
jgi:4-amino-4-deoxy-L-arabinose transferase-like glycosyltransferase